MAVDVLVEQVDEWAAGRGYAIDRDSMRTVLEISQAHFRRDSPTDFQPGDIEQLLLEVVPDKRLVESEAEAVDVARSVQLLLEFSGDTNRMPADRAEQLIDELDDVASAFIRATMDNWRDQEDDFLLQLITAFGFATDYLPPIRLPDDAELATAARASRMLTRARQSATEDEFLGHLVEALGARDDELQPGFEVWPDGDDEEVVAVWQRALAFLLTESFDATAGLAAFMMLYLARGDGVPLPELHELVEANKDDDESTAAVLVDALTDLGAVTVDEDETVRLTPLAVDAMAAQLVERGLEISLLPPPESMTAADLVDLAGDLPNVEMAAEFAAWSAKLGAREAAKQLLAAAVESDTTGRVWATSVVLDLGAEVEPIWQNALDVDVLRPYAKTALWQELDEDERGWLAIDALSVAMDQGDIELLLETIETVLPAGEEEKILETLWRLSHPDLGDVLTVIGEVHPDKRAAKLARRAAHKAASR
jgi:hypothetical protein